MIFLVGWLVAKILAYLTLKFLKIIKFDTLAEKVNAISYLSKANISLSPSRLISKFVYWIMLLLVIITASETMGWEVVSNEIAKLIAYLPKLVVAIVLFIIGTYIASFIRDIILGATRSLGISSGKILAQFVFYFLFITVVLTSLNQAGVNTSIITSNLFLILGSILIAAAISYGFASRDVLKNILSGYFIRNDYKVGMIIEVDGEKGKIISLTNISITIANETGRKTVIPTSFLADQKVNIY